MLCDTPVVLTIAACRSTKGVLRQRGSTQRYTLIHRSATERRFRQLAPDHQAQLADWAYEQGCRLCRATPHVVVG
jgi:hypothetical protein